MFRDISGPLVMGHHREASSACSHCGEDIGTMSEHLEDQITCFRKRLRLNLCAGEHRKAERIRMLLIKGIQIETRAKLLRNWSHRHGNSTRGFEMLASQ